jgi:hypothetical protein
MSKRGKTLSAGTTEAVIAAAGGKSLEGKTLDALRSPPRSPLKGASAFVRELVCECEEEEEEEEFFNHYKNDL